MTDLRPSPGWWRYGVLLFDSFMSFGSLFCHDMPTALQHELITSPYIGTNSTNMDDSLNTTCDVCLGLGEVRYNLLHSSLRWTAAVLCLPVGYSIDRLGNSRSAILLTTLACVSSVLFALGTVSQARTTTSFYTLMVAGRVMLAFGQSPLRIVQDRVIAHWFHDDSYVPLAVSLLIRRSGILLNFLVTANIAEFLGFSIAVWFGAVLTAFGVICALGLGLTAYFGSKEQNQSVHVHIVGNTQETLKAIRVIPRRFWLLVVMIAVFYGGSSSLEANISNYLQLRYGYTMVAGSYLTGSIQVGPVLAPLIAAAMKFINCDGIVVTCAMTVMIPAYVVLGFCPSVHPVIITLLIGLASCVVVLVLWQVTVLLSPASCFGAVAGIVLLIRDCTMALGMLCNGYVLDDSTGYVDNINQMQRYDRFFLILIAIACLSVVCGVVLNVLDLRDNCVLNQRIERRRKEHEEKLPLVSTDKYT